jgi:hypothetical protein
LGHDPGPEVETGEDLRVWQDGGPNRHDGASIASTADHEVSLPY